MTITHPHHPLRGQQLPIVGIRHGASPDVIVRLPDGSHGAIALDATDYTGDASVPTHPRHLLDLTGLRQMATFIDALRRQGRLPQPPC